MSQPIAKDCSQITIKLGTHYDEESVIFTVTPVNPEDGVAKTYQGMFCFDLITPFLRDDTTGVMESYQLPDGFTWRDWYEHPAFTPGFFKIQGDNIVDLYGDNILRIDTAQAVKRDEYVENIIYVHHFDHG